MKDFRRAYGLNVSSMFRLCQLAAPHMESAGGGTILNVTSMSGDNRNPRMGSYGVAGTCRATERTGQPSR